MARVLEESARPLLEHHDLVMFDLDGVVYIDGAAVPGVPREIAAVRAAGVRVAFVTNNASRTPQAVADRLVGMGVEADAGDVVTSAQAAAHLLLDRYGPGAGVFALGGEGLRVALFDAGLRPLRGPDGAAALATGYGPDVRWHEVMRAATSVRDGLPWVASNTDLTIPTAHGQAPGHGVLVSMLTRFAGVRPTVAGKPQRPLLDETVRRVGGQHPLMVGDRLDTDIEGARTAGFPALLVMTGVTGVPELLAAPPEQRPSHIAAGVDGLRRPHPVPLRDAGGAALGGWTARVHEGVLRVEGRGDPSDWWRVVATSGWEHLDATGAPARTDDDLRAPLPDGGSEAL